MPQIYWQKKQKNKIIKNISQFSWIVSTELLILEKCGCSLCFVSEITVLEYQHLTADKQTSECPQDSPPQTEAIYNEKLSFLLILRWPSYPPAKPFTFSIMDEDSHGNYLEVIVWSLNLGWGESKDAAVVLRYSSLIDSGKWKNLSECKCVSLALDPLVRISEGQRLGSCIDTSLQLILMYKSNKETQLSSRF